MTAPRARILDAALSLMGDQGAAGTSMRQVAALSGLNVATLYHYFPSKADLLKSVIEDQRYIERLAADRPPGDPATPPRERFVELMGWLWDATLREESVWRLLVGEALRGEAVAQSSARDLVAALEATFTDWLRARFPELPGDARAAARLVRSTLFAQVVEHLVTGVDDADQRAADLAALLFPAA